MYEEVGIGRKVVMPITVENVKPNTPKPDTGKKPSKKVKVTSIRLSGPLKQIAAGKKLTLKAAVLQRLLRIKSYSGNPAIQKLQP